MASIIDYGNGFIVDADKLADVCRRCSLDDQIVWQATARDSRICGPVLKSSLPT